MKKRIIVKAVCMFAALGTVALTAYAVYDIFKIKKITDRADEDPIDTLPEESFGSLEDGEDCTACR